MKIAATALFALLVTTTSVTAQSLHPVCCQLFLTYQNRYLPKAFVISNSYNYCGFATDRRTLQAAQAVALRGCTAKGQHGCRIIGLLPVSWTGS